MCLHVIKSGLVFSSKNICVIHAFNKFLRNLFIYLCSEIPINCHSLESDDSDSSFWGLSYVNRIPATLDWGYLVFFIIKKKCLKDMYFNNFYFLLSQQEESIGFVIFFLNSCFDEFTHFKGKKTRNACFYKMSFWQSVTQNLWSLYRWNKWTKFNKVLN